MKKILFNLLFIILVTAHNSITQGMNASDKPIQTWCIICAGENRTYQYFFDLKTHLKKHHECESRNLFVCNSCDFSGAAVEIRRHLLHAHGIKKYNCNGIPEVRLPKMKPDETITPEQMIDFSGRLYALIDDLSISK